MKKRALKSKLILIILAITFFTLGIFGTLIFQNILFKSNMKNVQLMPQPALRQQAKVVCVWIPCLNPLVCGLAGYWLCSDGTVRSWEEMFPKQSNRAV